MRETAEGRLALDGTGQKALDEVLLEGEEDDERQHHRDHGCGGQ